MRGEKRPYGSQMMICLEDLIRRFRDYQIIGCETGSLLSINARRIIKNLLN